MAARKLDKSIDLDKGTLTVGFPSGSTLEVKMTDLPEEMVHQLAFHGLSQKATDATAGKDPAASEAAVRSVVDALLAGNWTVRGSGTGGGGAGRVTLLAEAVARLKGIEVAKAAELIAGLTDEEKKNLQAAKSVKAVILDIKAERLAASQEKDDKSDDILDVIGTSKGK